MMIALLFACQFESETLVLLDEKISEIHVTQARGLQLTDEDETETIYTFTEPNEIAVLEKALTTAVVHEKLVPSVDPTINVYVKYEGELPVHAFHFWLENEKEQSMFMQLRSLFQQKVE